MHFWSYGFGKTFEYSIIRIGEDYLILQCIVGFESIIQILNYVVRDLRDDVIHFHWDALQ